MFEAYKQRYPRAIAISVPEFLQPIGATRPWLYAQERAGRIKTVKRGKRIFVPMSEVERFFSDRLTSVD